MDWATSYRVVRVDFVTPKVTVLEFPRDLWVEIPYISDNLNGLDHGKLNQAYLYGQPGDGFAYSDDPSQGPRLLSLTLTLNFGILADHYLAVNMRTCEAALGACAPVVPDAVLLDVMLPGIAGYEVCRRLKSDARTRGTFVVLMTAGHQETERIRAMEAGADRYLAKPFSPGQLLDLVQRELEARAR